MTEPIVIPLKRGQRTDVEVHYGGHKSELTFGPAPGECVDGPFLRIADVYTHADFWMPPDPVRAAVLAALETAKRRVAVDLRSLDQDALATSLFAAIDAVLAEPSDAELRGGQSTIEGLTLQLAEQTARIQLLEGQLDTRTQQRDGCRVELDRERERVTPHPIGGWAEQIRALRQEVCNLVAERADAVASLAKRSEELATYRVEREKFDKQSIRLHAELAHLQTQLAACREELDVTRGELASALSEGDALKDERDYLAKGLREVQVELGKVLGAEAAPEPKA